MDDAKQRAHDDRAGVFLRDLWTAVSRHRWLVAASLALALGAGAALAAYLPPAYEASALIRVDGQSAAGRVPALGVLDGLRAGGEVGTEVEVLQSRTLARAVVDSLHLRLRVASPRGVARDRLFARVHVSPEADSAAYRLTRAPDGRYRVEDGAGRALGSFAPGEAVPLPGVEVVLAAGPDVPPEAEVEVVPRERAVDDLVAALEVERPSRDASVIRIRYRGGDPRLVRDVPNALAAHFLALRQDVQKVEARSTAHFLRGQLDTLAVQLAAAEERLRGFREGAGVVDLGVEGSTQLSHLAGLQAERNALEAERSSLASLLAEAREAEAHHRPGTPSPYRRLIAFPALMRNQVASEILGSLSRVESERAELLTRRKVEDPEVAALTGRIAEMEAQLRALVETYLQGLTNQIASLDGSLGEYRARLERIPSKELEFARLSRQPRVLAEMYALLQTRLKEAEIAEAVEDPSVRVVDAAVLPTRPVAPRRGLILGTAALLGLLLGAGLGYARELSDETVHTSDDLQVATGIPVLGLIPRVQPERGRGILPGRRRALLPAPDEERGSGTGRVSEDAPAALLVRDADTLTPVTDAYDWLHTNILFARPESELRTLLFTSALPGDGKTTTAVNLSITLAQRGMRVLLVDGDLRRGTVGSIFRGAPGPGLAEVLAGEAAPREALRRAQVGGGATLHYVPAGGSAHHPARMLRSAAMREFLEWAARSYDRVVVDSPPLSIISDAAVLGRAVDGVVIVARAGVTPFGALVHAAEQFRRARMPVLGTVMNDFDFERDAAYAQDYRWYGYGSAYYAGELKE